MSDLNRHTDLAALGFLLDLEYFQADFYLRAVKGHCLAGVECGPHAGTIGGGRRVEFKNETVKAFINETAQAEQNHVKLLRDLIFEIGNQDWVAPAVDYEASFSSFARASKLCNDGQTFDPFVNETNLLLAAYIFEDVVTSAYLGVIPMLDHRHCLTVVSGILASEAGHSSVIRTFLFSMGLADQTNRISIHRQMLAELSGTNYQGGDHGVGTPQSPSIAYVDGRAMALSRTVDQSRHILCGAVGCEKGFFFPRGFGSLATFDLVASDNFVPHHNDLAAELAAYGNTDVTLPALTLAEEDLLEFDVRDANIAQTWRQNSYISRIPRVLSFKNAIVHGSVGITAACGHVLEESLWHTMPKKHRYLRVDQQVSLDLSKIQCIPGTAISVLTGSAESYFHSFFDAIMRLILVPEDVWARARHVFLPSTGINQLELFALFGAPEEAKPKLVEPSETLLVEELIHPTSLHGVVDFHPALTMKCFKRLLSHLPPDISDRPKRIFLDRRGSAQRKLLNESEVVAALPNFVAVRLEDLSAAEQIRLFYGADIIVAPHGAGLSNIGFCRSGTVVVELMMDRYCHWGFRRLAAVANLPYLPVFGRAEDLGADISPHLLTWRIGIGAVLEAVATAEDLCNVR